MTDDEAKAIGARALATGLWTDAQGFWPAGSVDCDGRLKYTVSGEAATIRTFLAGGAAALGLVDTYGDPARGFAGGYAAAAT